MYRNKGHNDQTAQRILWQLKSIQRQISSSHGTPRVTRFGTFGRYSVSLPPDMQKIKYKIAYRVAGEPIATTTYQLIPYRSSFSTDLSSIPSGSTVNISSVQSSPFIMATQLHTIVSQLQTSASVALQNQTVAFCNTSETRLCFEAIFWY